MAKKKEQKKIKRRKVRTKLQGILNIKSTYNNTIASLCNKRGDVLCWSSCGSSKPATPKAKKFKDHEKKSENAAYFAISAICAKGKERGFGSVIVRLNGYGRASNIIFKVLKHYKISVLELKDVTPIAFNGCKASKIRRKKRHLKH